MLNVRMWLQWPLTAHRACLLRMFSAAAAQVIRDVMLAGRQAAEGRHQRCVERLRNSVIMVLDTVVVLQT